MVFSDDEVEAVAQSVTNYYFVDGSGEAISFSVLPIRWNDSDSQTFLKQNVFLHGITDSGSESVYKRVIAWKFECLYDRPEISVLSKKKRWIKLQKPRKSFEDTIRTILITIHCLHCVKKQPEKSESCLWRHLQNAFSYYKVKPSEMDLLDHLPLIKAAVKQDKTFAKSVVMRAIMTDRKRRRVFDEQDNHLDLVVKKTKFTPENDQEFNGTTKGNYLERVWDMCDDLCALCDNGGEVLCCEGRCLRSFHASVEAGYPSGCKSLRLPSEQVKAMKNFVCMNCKHNRHQCLACGKLGYSSRSNNPEVFQCASASCGHFYHPRCIAKLLHPINDHAAEQVQEKIFAGKPFTCTVHKCSICKQEEDENVEELQFAICRRCPKVYHRKCLPSRISLESFIDKGILQRAWDNLIPKRIVIYCLKHEIDIRTLAPEGNHIVFPDVSDKKKISFEISQPSHEKILTKKISVDSSNHPKTVLVNQLKERGKMPFAIKGHSSTELFTKQASRASFGYKRSLQAIDTSRLHVKDKIKPKKVDNSPRLDETIISMKGKSSNQMLKRSFGVDKSKQKGVPCSISEKTTRGVPVSKKSSSLHSSVRTETEINGMDFVKGNSSSKAPSETSPQTYPCNIIDKAIPKGSVEGSVKAVDTSMQKLEDQSFDDHKANYITETFSNLTKSKIADTLLCYAKPGDMMANFYCHANDFSCSTREKFEESSKKCSVKNYDVFQWKEFDFKKGIQMATGSRLITGLIFPSGVEPVHVNKFVDKVLVFKPKLLLLICPRGTKRLDQNECDYEHVWEEDELVSSKSYICESMHLNEQANQRTFESAIMYLWSRGDWTSNHKSIALNEGHISRLRKDPNLEDTSNDSDVTNQINNTPEENSETEKFMETRETVCEGAPDVCVLEHCIQDDRATLKDQVKQYQDNNHDIVTVTEKISESEIVLNEDSALFAPGLLPLFSNQSCGWLDE